MKTDKLYNVLLDLYRAVYSSIGYNFDDIDKEDNFFWKYEIDGSAEDKIVNDFINSQKLTKFQKIIIKNNYYMGVSPKRV